MSTKRGRQRLNWIVRQGRSLWFERSPPFGNYHDPDPQNLRPTAASEYVYSYLPEKLMCLVLDQVKKHTRDKRPKTVRRD